MALSGATNGISSDYHIMEAEDMDDMFFSGYEQALGEETRDRMTKQVENYEYYEGRQHRDDQGNLIDASELERPAELDYDPTRFTTNYFKTVIDRKARWQMSGDHTIHVPREQIDDPLDRIEEGYEPSAEQAKENERAENMEKLLSDLWRENKMRAKLLRAARDRLIADRVVCKIVYNSNTGRLKWVWRPDYEYIPVYSDDDFEELIGCYFVMPRKEMVNGEEVDAVKIQSYTMLEGEAYLHEGIYEMEDLKLIEELVPSEDDDLPGTIENIEGKRHKTLGMDFLPIVEVPVDQLIASASGEGEISDLRSQNDILNQMNEDAVDSLKFEMFPITAVINAPPGTADKMEIAPGAVVEARSTSDGGTPEIRKIESGFGWKEAFKDQYSRVKGAMHEISGLPQIVPQELNFGGLNTEALRILFHDIISDTEEHWLSWGYALAELHEKSIKYLQARLSDSEFAYDKDVVRSIEDYESEVKFVLPLPDNRKELVNLLTSELSQDLESHAGAMERLGVDNVPAKKKEIANEKMQELMQQDPYGIEGDAGGELDEDDTQPTGGGGSSEEGTREVSATERRNENGELEVLCDRCGGSGQVISESTGKTITCPKCAGFGWYQPRKR